MQDNEFDRNVITDENVDEIMDTAGYGITYWATSPTEGQLAKAPEDTSFVIVEDEEDGSGEVHYLTRDHIRDAFLKILGPEQTLVNDRVQGYLLAAWRDRDGEGIDTTHVDSDAADCIVQVAAFGRLVYG
ncbi:hypothetical protein [Saccharothrix sp. HUAS TT1]|uniref:hypothetical protein n=1 Tax=unclassified Saccharothrix TaxID=2593673 RepID=UPI00345BF20F